MKYVGMTGMEGNCLIEAPSFPSFTKRVKKNTQEYKNGTFNT